MLYGGNVVVGSNPTPSATEPSLLTQRRFSLYNVTNDERIKLP